jgi:hypothetical protein
METQDNRTAAGDPALDYSQKAAIINDDGFSVAAFETFLKGCTPTVQDTSINIYKYMLRRLKKELGPEDFFDPGILTVYRQHLPQGTRNVFDATWDRLQVWTAQTFAHGLPERPTMARVRHAHPLHHDMTVISGIISPAWIEGLTWGDLRSGKVEHDPALLGSAARILAFYEGVTSDSVPDSKPLIVHAGKQTPMRVWHMEWIINSAQSVSKGPVEEASAEIFSLFVSAKVPGKILRMVARDLYLARTKIARQYDAKPIIKSMIEHLKARRMNDFQNVLHPFIDSTEEDRIPLW